MDSFSHVKSLPPIFPFDMMEYLIKNPPQKPQTQLKLIKTCKLFFQKHPIVPVDDLHTTNVDNSVRLGLRDFTFKLKDMDPKLKFWVCGEFRFLPGHFAIHDKDNSNRDSFIALKSRIYRCFLTKLVLVSVTLTQDEWKFLVAGDELRDLELWWCNVKILSNKTMPLEDMLTYVNDKIGDVRFWSPLSAYYTPLTFKKLGLHFTNFKKLHLTNITADLNPDDVAQFTKEHPAAQCWLHFDETYPDIQKNRFKERLSSLTNEIRSRIYVH